MTTYARVQAMPGEKFLFALGAVKFWTCTKCGYKQRTDMDCYCKEFEEMRRNWAANQNIATKGESNEHPHFRQSYGVRNH